MRVLPRPRPEAAEHRFQPGQLTEARPRLASEQLVDGRAVEAGRRGNLGDRTCPDLLAEVHGERCSGKGLGWGVGTDLGPGAAGGTPEPRGFTSVLPRSPRHDATVGAQAEAMSKYGDGFAAAVAILRHAGSSGPAPMDADDERGLE